MGRFASTVPFYEQARQPYGAAFFGQVAAALAIAPGWRLLDLGTGPGLLALGFAPYVAEVVGVDPEPAMLDAARAAAARAGTAIRFVEGRAETLPDTLGCFEVVTIGRALHWMEPEPTRATLDRIVAPHGCVLICRAASVADGRNPWLAAYEAVRGRWTKAAEAERYAVDRDGFFERTRFRRRAMISVEQRQEVTVAALVERVLSMSSSSPERIGADRSRMAEDIGEALAPFVQDGRVADIVEARAEVFSSQG